MIIGGQKRKTPEFAHMNAEVPCFIQWDDEPMYLLNIATDHAYENIHPAESQLNPPTLSEAMEIQNTFHLLLSIVYSDSG